MCPTTTSYGKSSIKSVDKQNRPCAYALCFGEYLVSHCTLRSEDILQSGPLLSWNRVAFRCSSVALS